MVSVGLQLQALERCPVCDSDHHHPFYLGTYRGAEMPYRICDSCGARFLTPRMSDDASRIYYQNHYRKVVQHEDGDNEAHQRKRAMHFLRILKDMDVTPKHHLDVGCSIGIMLQVMMKETGCVSVGTEWGDADRHTARERGLTVVTEFVDLNESSYDLITLAHVLEHANNPVQFLRDVKDLKTDGGYILLEVPNAEAIHHAYLMHHPVAYTWQSLMHLLQIVKLEMVTTVFHAVPFDNVPLSINITMLVR